MTGAGVLAQDQLFATLDPTMRGVELETGARVILSDTVGFISDLPTQLVAAFRATLEEVLAADLILHVRDISHAETEAQADDVHKILSELGVDEHTPMIEVWNKIDAVSDPEPLETIAARRADIVAISALSGTGTLELVVEIGAALDGARISEDMHLDFSQGRQRAWLHDQKIVQDEAQDDTGWALSLSWTARQKSAFESL